MTPAKSVLYLTCLFWGDMAHTSDVKVSSSARQERRFVPAKVGDNVTLRCFYDGNESAWLYWYKQTLGQTPRLICRSYVFDTRVTFSHEFKNNPRFTVDSENTAKHLTIFDLDISDSATYYCASSYAQEFTFAAGATVSVKGSGLNVPASVHQSVSETIQPGGSVTLNCTVHTGSCDDGEHSVYWFKSSEESHPGLIYSHGGRNDQCERKADTQTHTCVYNLPMKSLNPSHTGTYYCAVASCGHLLFGDGTKLDFEHEEASLVLVYILSGALAFTIILVVLLAFSVYRMNKRDSCQCTESRARSSAPSTANAESFQNADSLHYAALSINLPNRSRRHRNNTNDECVYSSVKQ